MGHRMENDPRWGIALFGLWLHFRMKIEEQICGKEEERKMNKQLKLRGKEKKGRGKEERNAREKRGKKGMGTLW